MDRVELSILVPCYDEEDNVAALVARVSRVIAELFEPGAAELVLVDDGSRDQTHARIVEAAAMHDFVVTARHDTNRGLTEAWKTALAMSRGEYVCILDADLQYRPEDLGRLREAMHATAADIAQGWRSPVGRRRDTRYAISRGLSLLLNTVFGMSLHDNKSGFVLCRREVLADLLRHRGRYTYWQILLLVAANAKGYRICEVETAFDERRAGRSFLPALPVLAVLRASKDVGRAVLEYKLGVDFGGDDERVVPSEGRRAREAASSKSPGRR